VIGSWPWWAGALALGALAVGYFVVVRRSFGVSGAVSRVVDALTGPGPEPTHGCGSEPGAEAPPPVVSAYATFLLAIVGGSLLAVLTGGGWQPTMSVGPTFHAAFEPGLASAAALVLGGTLVGFGTRMAGGCTSGHGLCGTGRLQIPSIVATATFFGAGVGVSFLWKALA